MRSQFGVISVFSFFLSFFFCCVCVSFIGVVLLCSALSLHWLCFTCWYACICMQCIVTSVHSCKCVCVYVEQHLHALKCLNPWLMWSKLLRVWCVYCLLPHQPNRMSVCVCVCECEYLYSHRMVVWVGFSLKVNQCARWFRLVERETTNCADTKINKFRVWGACGISILTVYPAHFQCKQQKVNKNYKFDLCREKFIVFRINEFVK